MTIQLFRAVEAARILLAEGHPLARAANAAAAEFGVSPEDVARLAWQAHTECRAARIESQTAPAGLPGTLERN